SGPAAPPVPSGPSPSVSQIQKMSGWDSCSACAGKNGDGPGTSHDMATGINSPSISGSSGKFWVGGTPWGAALWWHGLGGQDDAAADWTSPFRVISTDREGTSLSGLITSMSRGGN